MHDTDNDTDNDDTDNDTDNDDTDNDDAVLIPIMMMRYWYR